MSIFTSKQILLYRTHVFAENSLKYSDSFSPRHCFLQGWGRRDTIFFGTAVRRRSEPTINSFKAAEGEIMMSPATVPRWHYFAQTSSLVHLLLAHYFTATLYTKAVCKIYIARCFSSCVCHTRRPFLVPLLKPAQLPFTHWEKLILSRGPFKPHLTVCAGIPAALGVLRSVVPKEAHHQLSWGRETDWRLNNLVPYSDSHSGSKIHRTRLYLYLFWGPPRAPISWQHTGEISSWGRIVAARCLLHRSPLRPSRRLRNTAARPPHPRPAVEEYKRNTRTDRVSLIMINNETVRHLFTLFFII